MDGIRKTLKLTREIELLIPSQKQAPFILRGLAFLCSILFLRQKI